MDDFVIRYVFTFPDRKKERFRVHLDKESLALLSPLPEEPSAWTTLDFHQCPNCPLRTERSPRCPAALALQPLVDAFARILSYHELQAMVITPERVVANKVSAQQGVSSLMGLVLAASGCPRTSCFRPMARFHLPFSSEEETFYRAASMHLLAQYFRRKQGQEGDLEMGGLKKIYAELQTVNQSLAERLRAASEVDSTINALILLDLFTRSVPRAIEDSMADVRYLFKPYLNDSV